MPNDDMKPHLRERDALAFEEIKLHQEVIARKESFVFQMRGWLMTLLSALVVLLFSADGRISPWIFAITGLIVIGVFLYLEISEYQPLKRAIKRVKDIEIDIENRVEYSAPRLSRIYGRRLTWEEKWKELRQGPLVLRYGLFVFLVIAVALMAAGRP